MEQKIMKITQISLFFSIVFIVNSLKADVLDYWAFEAQFYGSQQSLSNSQLNPQNSYLKIPEVIYKWNVRPDLKFSILNAQFTLRPQFFSLDSDYRFNNGDLTNANTNKVQWNEAFITIPFSENLKVYYGLQNFQWGPAEAASPSNFIFNDTILLKDTLVDLYGKHLLRFNYSPTSNWNEILIAEISANGIDNSHPEFEDQEKFAHKILFKSDWNWNHGADYLGLVIGWRENFGFKLGEYYNTEIFDGFSFYIDVDHKKSSLAWYPTAQESSGLISLEQNKKTSGKIYSYFVSGLKYAFENGTDLRLEGIFQEDGYNKDEFSQLNTAFSSSSNQQKMLNLNNLEKYIYNGLYFPGQKYILVSFTDPNTFQIKNWLVSIKDMYSLSDRSSSLNLYSEKNWNTQMTVFINILKNLGANDTELNRFVSSSYTFGLKYNW